MHWLFWHSMFKSWIQNMQSLRVGRNKEFRSISKFATIITYLRSLFAINKYFPTFIDQPLLLLNLF
jgi:hypothetical protein